MIDDISVWAMERPLGQASSYTDYQIIYCMFLELLVPYCH